MKKTISLLLILTMLLSLLACANTIEPTPPTDGESVTDASDVTDKPAESEKSTDNSTDKSTDKATDKPTDDSTDKPTHVHAYSAVVTESTLEAEGFTTYTCECGDSYISDLTPKKIEIPLISSGVASAKILLPSEQNLKAIYARDRIQLTMNDIAKIPLTEEGEADFEILIGDTGRAESEALKAALGADEYAIRLFEDKLVIAASNDAFLYEAARYFCDNYLVEPRLQNKDGNVSVITDPIDVKRAGDKTSVHYVIAENNKPTAKAIEFATIDNQKYGLPECDPYIYVRQGGCFNGDDYYQVFVGKDNEIGVVAKKNIKTGELIYSEPIYMSHANDATYAPYTNRLYVGYEKTVWIYDGTTLELLETKAISRSASRISYSPERRTFVLGSYNFCDESFTYQGKFTSHLGDLYGDLKLNSQGTACDDTFIYSLLFEKVSTGVYNAYVGIFDWYGNVLAFVTVEISGKFEPQNVSIVDGKLYIAACSTHPVATLYEISFE